MILQRAELIVREGTEDEFATILKERGIALLSTGEGCHSVRVGRGVENPHKFILLLEWDSVEQHMVYVDSADHEEFSKLFAPFAAGGVMEHFDMW